MIFADSLFSTLVEQLIALVIDLFLAGAETSSNAIGYQLIHLK